MAKYSLRLDEICNYLYSGNEETLNNANFNNEWGGGFNTELPNPFINETDVDTIIASVREKIFDFTYPVPNNSTDKKVELETKIIKHYYMHEIGFETYGRFKLALNERMNLIMPYFNELYKSVELQGDDPLSNTDIVEMKNTKIDSTSSVNSTNEGNSTSNRIFQDTPTSELGNTDYATNITDEKNTSSNNSNSTGKGNENEDMIRTIKGLSGYSKQDMIQRYRENIINVDEAIINELYDNLVTCNKESYELFMKCYNQDIVKLSRLSNNVIPMFESGIFFGTRNDDYTVNCYITDDVKRAAKNIFENNGFEKLRIDKMNNGTSFKELKIGRNDPCPCGSGKKYKKCCGR